MVRGCNEGSTFCIGLSIWFCFKNLLLIKLVMTKGYRVQATIDCESLSFSSDLVWGVDALASVERCKKRGRQLSHRSPLACLGRFARRTKKKERLLVV